MRTHLLGIAVASVLGWRSAESTAQEGNVPVTRASQELPRPGHDRPENRETGPDTADRSADLWYGTPGVRPGGDLLGPILDLARRPSGLLDFRPRRVPPYLPDRDTAEFLRERR